MKQKMFSLGLYILTLLVIGIFLSACENIDISKLSDKDLERIADKAVVCNEPYIRFGTSCCLDQNNNNICDQDEKIESKYKEDVKVDVEEKSVEDLFIYLGDGGEDFFKGEEVVQQRKVKVRFDLLEDENIDTINLNLFDGFDYIVKRTSLVKCEDDPYRKKRLCGKNEYIWQGEIPKPKYPDEPGHSVIFVVKDGTVAGNIDPIPGINSYGYHVRGSAENQMLSEIDPSKFPEGVDDAIEVSEEDIEKVGICPDEWIVNKMPCACVTDSCEECNDPPREYFIINGERRELSEFDVDWVKENCDVKPQDVY